MLLDPFVLFGRMFVAFVLILGYLFVGVIEAVWYACSGRRDMIGTAIGQTGRMIVETVGYVFRK